MNDDVKWLFDLALAVEIAQNGIIQKKTMRVRKITKGRRIEIKNTIVEHRLRQISWDITCKELGLAKNTYYRLIDEIQKETFERGIQNRMLLLSEFYSNSKKQIAMAISEFDKTKKPQFLALAIKGELQLFKALQSTGYIPTSEILKKESEEQKKISVAQIWAQAVEKVATKAINDTKVSTQL